jgi:Tol biopolymer transport system component
MTIDPESLRATGIERLTTGPETDAQLSLSADGKKLAFTGANEQVRAWLFPFDSNRAQVKGSGHPITSAAVEAFSPSLSADGSKLGFSTVRQDRLDHWVKTLSDNRDISVPNGDSFARTFPTWSPDGRRIAYSRQELSTGKFDLAEWSPVNRKEESLANLSAAFCRVWDWSRDGKTLLLSQVNSKGDFNEIWALTVGAHPNESTERRIASSRTHSLYQPQFSPNGRWIAFEAVRTNADGLESRLYAVSATGGAWIPLTDGKWDDKPRWSPDGRTIYFLSAQRGFFDLWGIRFDPINGRRSGTAFLVKTFEDSSFMIPKNMVDVEISVTPNRLMVPLQQVSGGIWMLDNLDH